MKENDSIPRGKEKGKNVVEHEHQPRGMKRTAKEVDLDKGGVESVEANLVGEVDPTGMEGRHYDGIMKSHGKANDKRPSNTQTPSEKVHTARKKAAPEVAPEELNNEQ